MDPAAPRPWCPRCRRPGSTCLCSSLAFLVPATRFVFLMHPKEARKTKNGTGRLAHLSLAGSELLVGVDFREHPRVNELLSDSRYSCRLLYPQAANAGPGADPGGGLPVLFVLDGTWPSAKKMMKLSTNLHGLPRVSLPASAPSEFRTKHQPDPACLATIEAVDRVLSALQAQGSEVHGPADSARLLAPFRRMVAMSIEHAANPPAGSYRLSGPFRAPESRSSRRRLTTSGRNIVFQGGEAMDVV